MHARHRPWCPQPSPPDEDEPNADAQDRQSVFCKPAGQPAVDRLQSCSIHVGNVIGVDE
jgi:hypothetical protein